MKLTSITRRGIKIIFGVVALSCILAYNWNHTGGVLSSFVDPRWLGYVAAFGIEAVVVGLSLQISEARRTKTPDGFFVGTLIAVVVISAIANVAEGYLIKYGHALLWSNFGEIDFAQALVWLSSTGLLSLVTFALAEIIGSDTAQPDNKLLVETPVLLVPKQTTQARPLTPLTDSFVRAVWLAKKSSAPFADIQDAAHACLNGTSGALETWLAAGKQSMNELATVLQIDPSDRTVFEATCRGLRKTQGTEIKRL